MSAAHEPPWVPLVQLLICIAAVGCLWWFDHPAIAAFALISFCYIGVLHHLNEQEERHREWQRAAEVSAQRRHEELMRALQAIYRQASGQPPSDDD